MPREPDHRTSAIAGCGLALAAAAALWWLNASALALERGSDAARSAIQLLAGAWYARAVAVALLAPRAGAAFGGRAAAAAMLQLVAPAWPVVVLAWSATDTAALKVALSELVLLLAGALFSAFGGGLRRMLPSADLAQATTTLAGCAFAAAIWALGQRLPV